MARVGDIAREMWLLFAKVGGEAHSADYTHPFLRKVGSLFKGRSKHTESGQARK